MTTPNAPLFQTKRFSRCVRRLTYTSTVEADAYPWQPYDPVNDILDYILEVRHHLRLRNVVAQLLGHVAFRGIDGCSVGCGCL